MSRTAEYANAVYRSFPFSRYYTNKSDAQTNSAASVVMENATDFLRAYDSPGCYPTMSEL